MAPQTSAQRTPPTIALMNPAAPAVVTAAFLACCCPEAVIAQTTSTTAPAGGYAGMLSGIVDWFRMDWTTGWEQGSTMRLMTSPYTYHFSEDPNHKYVYMIGLERQRSDGFTVGGTFFRNSFGQPSTYLYIGQRFDRLGGVERAFAQITGGLLYGYKDPYQNKVPFNHRGYSPGLVPSIGWQFTRTYSAQIDVLGNSAVMFQFSAEF